jgi:class 3 adenylate cyclase/TolA-binding protein
MKIRLYILLIALSTSQLASKAENKTIDSLLSVLKMAKEDTSRVSILNNLSLQYRKAGNIEECKKHADNAFVLANKLHFKNGIAGALTNLGQFYERQNAMDEAYNKYSTALKLFIETEDKDNIAQSNNNIGRVFYNQSNYLKAKTYYEATLRMKDEVKNRKIIANANNALGVLNYAQGNYPQALSYYFPVLKIRESLGDYNAIGDSYSNIGVIYYEQKNYAEALKNFEEGKKNGEKAGSKTAISSCLSNMGMVYYDMGKYKEALEKNFAALKINKETGNRVWEANNYYNISENFNSLGNYSEGEKNALISLKIREEIEDLAGMAASYYGIGLIKIKFHHEQEGIDLLLKALKIAKEIGDKDLLQSLYFSLSQSDSTRGNYKGAYENHKLYILYRDSLFNEENTKKTVQTQMQYEFDKKEVATKAEQEKKDIRQRNIRYSISAGLLVALVFLGIVYRQRNNIKKEKHRSEELLLNILPSEVAEELKAKGNAEAKHFDEVTVMFTDFVEFTKISERLSPQVLVQELHDCFSAFDAIMERNGLEKIKTVGDAYIAVCGLPVPNKQHAEKTVQAAIEILEFMESRKKQEKVFEIRVGVHSGPVVAGIVGVKKFAYDIWGDTVNTAARMEQSSEAGKINISETTYALVKDKFTCTHRGKVAAKGKGEVDMYFVETAKII